MIKTIRIDNDHSIELNGSMGWLFKYRAQFGRDILPELMPMLEALVQLIAAAFDGGKDMKEMTAEDIVKNVDQVDLYNALSTLSGMELVTLIEIVWALAKNANKDISEPEEWVNQFEAFPIDEIMPEAINVILESSITSKNSQRLLKMMKTKK